jgi:hypothetical protein
MEGARKFRCDLLDFMQRGVRKRIVEGFVDVAKGHAVRKTFEDQFNGKAGTAKWRVCRRAVPGPLQSTGNPYRAEAATPTYVVPFPV